MTYLAYLHDCHCCHNERSIDQKKVVRDSLGEALEEYAPSTPEKEEEVLFKDGGP